jgi:hypothetical protein
MSEATIDPPDVRGWSVASGLGRVAIGLGLLAAPEHAARALGFEQVNTATVAVSRIAGVRDFVLGISTLAALDDRDRLRAATLANAAADAGDTLAFAAALGTSERRAAALGLGAALPATVAGVWALWRLN